MLRVTSSLAIGLTVGDEGVATIFSLAIARFYFDDSDRLVDIEVHITD